MAKCSLRRILQKRVSGRAKHVPHILLFPAAKSPAVSRRIISSFYHQPRFFCRNLFCGMGKLLGADFIRPVMAEGDSDGW